MGAAQNAAQFPVSNVKPLSQRNFKRLTAFIFDYSGISLHEGKRTMLEGRLQRRLSATGFAGFDAYVAWLFDEGNVETEGPHLINAVTTNKTDFFREPGHFDYLTSVVLPELKGKGVRTLRCWSAACSTGPEPYTLAMLLDDFVEADRSMNYGILATDLDSEVLETARRGIYPAELLEPVPEALYRRYVMMPRDPKRAQVRIAPELRSSIGFARMNLMSSRYPVGEPMHVIFCRNVLIYFDKPTQKRVVSQLLECLAPDGYLFLGHSESVAGFNLPIEQVANTVFKRS